MMTDTSTESETLAPTPSRGGRRGSMIALGAVLVVLGIVAAGAFGFWLGSSDETAAPPPEVEELIVDYRTAIGVQGSAGF